MPLDAVLIKGLVDELSRRLPGARIDKVQMPERDTILISGRAQGENLRLLMSANVGSARIGLTQLSFENPGTPPMFCMLLRKHLVGGRIASVTQPDFERMVIIELDCRDELGVPTRKRLIAELMGRAANIILVGEDGNIIDCIRRMDFGGDAARRLLPGMIYRMPAPQQKPCFFLLSADERLKIWRDSDREASLDKRLMDSFSGLSPLVARELAFRCREDAASMPPAMEALAETVEAGDYLPFMLLKDGLPADYSFMAISQYGDAMTGESFSDFSALLDNYYAKKDKAESIRRRSRDLSHSVRTARDRTARKLEARRGELLKTQGREEIRKNAELITANLYRMKKGESVLVCEDYYAEGAPEITIKLDPLKTPQQNSAAMYKEYNKLKTAVTYLEGLIAENEKQLDYLSSVLDEIERAESEKDLADIRRELTQTGFLRKPKGAKPDKSKPQGPLRFRSSEGYEILVGRNNAMNDELTTKTARRTDYWLHTQKIHGSHVIIRCEGETPPEKTLEEAASLAAYYSQARGGGKVAVDCTMARNLKKPSGAMPGFVIYNEYTTIMTQSDEELAEKLKI